MNLDDLDADDCPDGAALLDELHRVLTRYVVFPSVEAAHAVTLWIAATHAQPAWQHATRLVINSPVKRCGKSRLLDVVEHMSWGTLATVNATVAAVFRSIKDDDPPTLLIDEADSIFGDRKTAEQNEDLRGLLNAGFGRGRYALRCVGPNQTVTRFATFAMAALAGIGQMPDTITDRAVNITMRRRSSDERVLPFRIRRDAPELHDLRDQLHVWATAVLGALTDAEPDMPVEDRAADCWEPLVAVADAAGGDWPKRARAACVKLTDEAGDTDTDRSLSVRLLSDLRDIFGAAQAMSTEAVIAALAAVPEAPWADYYGRRVNPRDLGRLLAPYGVKSSKVKVDGKALQGYRRDHLHDPWKRYLPPQPAEDAEPPEPPEPPRSGGVGESGGSGTYPEPDEPAADLFWPGSGTSDLSGTSDEPLTSAVPEVPPVPDPRPGPERCEGCRRLLHPDLRARGTTRHPHCEPAPPLPDEPGDPEWMAALADELGDPDAT